MERKYIALIIIILMITSCKKHDPEKGVYFQDFENLITWGDYFRYLNNERAHSGSFSARIGDGIEYSYGFAMPLKELRKSGYGKMRVHAYGMISSKDCDAKLVMSVEGGKGLAWNAKKFNEFMGVPDRWEELSGIMVLPPDDSTANYLVRVYAWTQDGKPAWIDDIKVSFFK